MSKTLNKEGYLRLFGVLSHTMVRRDKAKIIIVGFILSATAILDLVAVGFVGILSVLAMSGLGVKSDSNNGNVSKILDVLYLGNQNIETQIILLGLVASLLFVLRTLLSLFVIKKLYKFLGRLSTNYASRLIDKIFHLQVQDLTARSTQDRLHAITTGADLLTIGLIGSVLSVQADIVLLFLLMGALMLVNVKMALLAMMLFGSIAVGLHFYLGKKARKLGLKRVEGDLKFRQMFTESTAVYPELTVMGKNDFFVSLLTKKRSDYALISSESSFLLLIGKYIIEASLIIGIVAMSIAEFALNDAQQAVGNLAIFIASATRIAPAVLRIQQNLMIVENSYGASRNALDILLEDPYFPLIKEQSAQNFAQPESPRIEIKDLAFSYGLNELVNKPILRDVNLNVDFGEFIAFVGQSGSGKSTMLKLMAGILEPTRGCIAVQGESPRDCIDRYKGILGYVPQDGALIRGTIRENITLGETTPIDDAGFWELLDKVSLSDFVRSLPDGLNTVIGGDDTKISGGQKQRICLARALHAKPKILFLDEATSALDAITESEISETLIHLVGQTTLVVVAHRLSTVRSASKVCYFEGGSIKAIGTFEEVRAAIPAFERQADLLGL
jgi:ABC-type multidrug transport system fused ATPase/permease subunit